MIKNNKPQHSKTVRTIYICQWVFAVIGIILALGAFINGGFLNYIASMIMFYSALIIAPIFEMIPALKKYSMASLVPRAIISFVLVTVAVMISPDSDSENRKTISQTVAETTSANDAVEKLTTTETKVKETTTTKVKTTTQTTTVATTTTTVPITTEPPTPAPTEPPYIPPVQSNERDYVLNTSTMKAHYPSCRDVNKIDDENRQDYYGTAEDLEYIGYSSCGHCHALK